MDKPQIQLLLGQVRVSIRDSLSQHAPEDMLAGNIGGLSFPMLQEMGNFEKGRVLNQTGLAEHARAAFYESARSGEADALAQSCDEAAAGGTEHYAHYYKGLLFEAMGNGDEALELFRTAHVYENLGNRPAVKLISALYSKHDLEGGRHYLEDALRRNLLSEGLLRHIARYLSLKGCPESAVRDYLQVCIRNGKSLQV